MSSASSPLPADPEHDGPASVDARTHVVVARGALADAVSGAAVTLDAEAVHHLVRVLRIRAGERITLTDGVGRWCEAVVDHGLDSNGFVLVDGAVRRMAPPAPVGVAFALTKGEKPETVIQKLTELGIARIVPVRAERSVVQWDDAKAHRNLARWDAVAGNAVEQSRGVWLPVIEPLTSVEALAARAGVVRADRGGRPLSTNDALVAVGPEGGWTPREREVLADAVGLPGQVLRAETAAIVAGALLVALVRPG